jgi:hypothetical protein
MRARHTLSSRRQYLAGTWVEMVRLKHDARIVNGQPYKYLRISTSSFRGESARDAERRVKPEWGEGKRRGSVTRYFYIRDLHAGNRQIHFSEGATIRPSKCGQAFRWALCGAPVVATVIGTDITLMLDCVRTAWSILCLHWCVSAGHWCAPACPSTL